MGRRTMATGPVAAEVMMTGSRVLQFRRRKPIVGVDIGVSTIKVLELEPPGSGPRRLLHLGVEPLEPDAIRGGMLKPHVVGWAIGRALESAGITTPDIVTSVSGHAVIVKTISLAEMSDEELQESIHREAEQDLPYEIADLAIDYKVTERGRRGTMNVLLVACRRDWIADYVSAISQTGRTPVFVDADVLALQNCYEAGYDVDPASLVCLLNVGASTMNVNIVRGSTSIFSRDIAVGGDRFTGAIQSELNLSWDLAEAAKKGSQVEGAPPERLAPIIHSVSEDLAAQVQRFLDFAKATGSEDRIDRILLSGGSSEIQGLREVLADRLELSVELMNPFNRITHDPRDLDPGSLATVSPSAAIAVGLALREPGGVEGRRPGGLLCP